jgi:hypothetical protein
MLTPLLTIVRGDVCQDLVRARLLTDEIRLAFASASNAAWRRSPAITS